jgi:hypothetical protein
LSRDGFGFKELAAEGSGDVRAWRQPSAELRVGKGAATPQSVYRKAIVPELQRGDEVMDQLFSWRHLPQRAEEARLKREAAPERRRYLSIHGSSLASS